MREQYRQVYMLEHGQEGFGEEQEGGCNWPPWIQTCGQVSNFLTCVYILLQKQNTSILSNKSLLREKLCSLLAMCTIVFE